MNSNTLYLVDGSNFLFRAYHAMPPMLTKSGLPTGAVRGFASMLLRLIGEEQPGHLAVVFDAGGRDKRAELFPEYKANRAECPADLRPQFDLARRLVRAIGIVCLDATDAEADDVIATLATLARKAGQRVVIVSSDKDLMQLVADGNIELLDTMKEEGRGKRYGAQEVTEKWGVPPTQLGDLLALMGDSSDNLPGVPGIGPKTAAQLISHFGSLTAMFDKLAQSGDLGELVLRGKDKVSAALRDHRERALLTRQLVTLDEEVPLTVGLADLARRPPVRDELLALLTELEFQTLLKRLQTPGGLPGMVDLSQPVGTPAAPSPAAAASAAPPVATPSAMTPIPSGAPQLLLTLEALRAWLAEAATAKRLAVVPVPWSDGHKPPVPRLASLCGLALYAPTAGAVYIPFGHRYLGAPAQLTAEAALGEVAPLLRDPALPKVVFGAKDTFLALETGGLRLLGVDSDPALASYLMNAAEDHRLPALIARYLPEGYPLPTSREQLTQSGKHGIPFDQVDIAAAAGYAGSEAQAIAALSEVLKLRLDAAGQALLDKLELPLASVLSTIERHGVLLDVGVLERLSRDAELRLRTLEGEIEALGGVRINLNSPKQLAELLFGKLGLPAVKKTRGKTGMSVDAEVLEALAAEHPSAHTIVRAIIEHRSLSKLKSTYMDQFPLLRDPGSGRLHTSFQQVVAATGRLSSTEPNLQNIPIRSELGQEIRRAFIAPPGATLIAADYSQIELRVLAHLSGDELLCESFRNGEDVHVRTAIAMFGPEEGRTADKRRAAKMINYGIVYGLTDFGLASRLGIARGVAKEYIREYFARYRGVRDFMEELVVRARSEGGARTLLGRFRPLPDLSNKNFALRGYAERMAKNTPIQGTAADILKQAMIDVQAQLGAHEPTTRMLLTVHDELVLEAPSERSEAVGTLVKTTMEKAAVLSVPLQVDVGTGHSWADC